MVTFKRMAVIALLLGFFSITTSVSASEGDIVLANRANTAARCEGGSVLMQNLNYTIYMSCRDITYPGGVEVVNYIVWANPTSGGNPIKLGDLDLGKKEFSTKIAFNTVFVTVERDNNVRTPSGPTLLQGTVTPYKTLESAPRPGTTASPLPTGNGTDATVSATPAPRTGFARLLTGGIIAFLGLFAIIFILFVITRR